MVGLNEGPRDTRDAVFDVAAFCRMVFKREREVPHDNVTCGGKGDCFAFTDVVAAFFGHATPMKSGGCIILYDDVMTWLLFIIVHCRTLVKPYLVIRCVGLICRTAMPCFYKSITLFCYLRSL